MALDKIPTDLIKDDAITAAKIPAGAVTASEVAADVATQAELDVVSTSVTANESEVDTLKTNLAILAFRQAVDHSDIMYNLQDQIIDEYVDASGVDASASTNETLASGAYSGISAVTVTEDADVGPTVDGDYTWYKYTTSGTFTISATTDFEYLVIAGGGGGAQGSRGGGGGAGGYRNSKSTGSETTGGGGAVESAISLVGGASNTITVGAGGAGGNNSSVDGTSGANSVFASITATGGGGGGGGYVLDADGLTGGSGGGGCGHATDAGEGGVAASPTQGYVGGAGNEGGPSCGGGGAGAGAVGNVGGSGGTDGDGGVGLSSSIDGSATARGGGGGGGAYETGNTTIGGTGGGGAGSHGYSGHGTAGTDGTGSGGGGAGGGTNQNGGDGGNGIVIIRTLTSNVGTAYQDLTLQSTDTTAETEADYADMVMLIEDTAGIATINTDIKGFVSEDSGVTFTQGTLVDEGDWGTNKRILAFHDLDISAQSGTAMCYKITTHNQAVGKQTKIHATSIGWR